LDKYYSLLQGIKTSCERLNRTMQNIALFENIKNKFTAGNSSSSEIKDVFKRSFQIKFRPLCKPKKEIVSTLITMS
jgi:two-component system sensor kinase